MTIKTRTFPETTFAQRLKLTMNRRGINGSQLADRVEVSTTCVHHWKHGHTLPEPRNLLAIAEALEVAEDYLRDGPLQASQDISEDNSPQSETVADMIGNLRIEIARITGLEVERVKLNLEFVSD